MIIMRIIIIFILIILLATSCNNTNISSHEYPDKHDDVWGALFESEGSYVWKTLTDEQMALLNYPELNKNKVYWVPNGKSYHAIDWCYTQSHSKTILSGSIKEAIEHNKNDS